MHLKKSTTICCLQENNFNFKDTFRITVKGQRYFMQVEAKRENLLIIDKIDFKPKMVTKH